MDTNFRRIDIDQYDEDVLLESELYEPDPRDPSQVLSDSKQKAGAVRSSLAQGDIPGALSIVLEGAPYGPNVEEAKTLNLQTLVSILNSTKATEIPGVVKALSQDAQDTLMKYLYKGMAMPGWGDVSGSVLLGWHEKLTEAAGTGCIHLRTSGRTRSLLRADAEIDERVYAADAKLRQTATLTSTTTIADIVCDSAQLLNKQLYAHIKDDNTWRRAYVYQFLGITPESDLRDDADGRALMLRREESSWRKEFVLRFNLRRRWERSRNAAVTHIPHHSAISSMHLMPSTTLLTASLQYGIVSRSYPLTGKILRGYLDASGTLNGLGIGNPNAEFSPHVSAVALASEGARRRCFGVSRTGKSRSRLRHARWMEAGQLRRSGRARQVWDAKTVKCLWTSDKGLSLVRDPCVKVTIDTLHGVIVGAMQSGDILVWSGLALLTDKPEALQLEPSEMRIPAYKADGSASPYGPNSALEVTDLHIACSDTKPLLVAYTNSAQFHRLSIDLSSCKVDRTIFGDDSTGPIRSLKPVFSSRHDETSFVLVGDQLGCISVFAWDALPTPGSAFVAAVRKFEAHEDGAVTAIAWNSTVLATGSSRGTVKIWDSLTFTPLRSFPSPAAKPVVGGEWEHVSQILLENDVVVASWSGSKVMAWKAGPVRKGNGKGKHVRGAKSTGVAKWHQQVEMYRDIAESRRDLEEEQAHIRRAFGRERAHQSTLAHLGLSEAEAVEYVLMLSRDEEEERRQRVLISREDEGVFIGDFDDVQTPVPVPDTFFGSESSSAVHSRGSSISSHSPSNGSVFPDGRSFWRTLPSASNFKIQVSPRVRPEPMEAGFTPSPINGSLSSSREVIHAPSTSDLEQFPAVSRTPSSASMSVPSTPGSSRVSSTHYSASGSPESFRSAWSTPLRSSGVPSPSRGLEASFPSFLRNANPPGNASAEGPSLVSAEFTQGVGDTAVRTQDVNQEEEDLRFAIELSIAEARSRGEEV
ncbi:hypothetical protein A0H81_05165 [Grifola frondosa]|uniref:Actin-related protein 2/3 complex subunit 5 n=1 Tax=Grifola frondosa TaxID=5627 RepID=A0A1C7MDA6_GRIFR|nr:hypothetical protein A0H81_05165 [Grifola frondosa]